MERRRRGQGPFQGGGAFAPRIGLGLAPTDGGLDQDRQEHRHTDDRHDVTDGGDLAPVGEGFRIVDVPARHALQTQEVLREEGEVGADEHPEEVDLARPFRILAARHLADPEVDPGEDGEHGAKRHHIVEVRDDVVGVLERSVDGGLAQHHAGHTADGEEEQEAEGEQHRRLQRDGAAPHGGDPREHLHPGRNRDDHRGQHEVALLRQRQADGVHVVCPHDEAQHADCHHRVNHRQVAEDRFFREGRDDVADDAEAGNDDDVDLWVTKEPQDVLIQHRIAATSGVEEGGAEVTVGDQHGDGASQHRQAEKDQPCGDEDRPREQRHLVQRHAGGAHVEEGGDHVDRTKDRRGARKVDREQREVGRITAFMSRERRIQHPADAGTGLLVATRCKDRADRQRHACDVEPVAEVVHPREGHVRRADVQRHEVVAKAAEQRGDHDEEHHQDTVRGDDDVPQVAIGRTGPRGVCDKAHTLLAHVLNARLHQLQPHVDGEDHRDQTDKAAGE
ncbi:hypothetical protein GALL_464280 [mine drainage metagenome]|uniref:Uncharacterized protein n=1 Tax=mine drainage metagenome TaxID=410659 RepID=A0A1J5PVW1_9ZZZZ